VECETLISHEWMKWWLLVVLIVWWNDCATGEQNRALHW